LPEENVDCAELAPKTLQNAIFNWRAQVGHRRKGRVTTENRFENRVAARAGDLVSQGYH
jgi:hypothetical protein